MEDYNQKSFEWPLENKDVTFKVPLNKVKDLVVRPLRISGGNPRTPGSSPLLFSPCALGGPRKCPTSGALGPDAPVGRCTTASSSPR